MAPIAWATSAALPTLVWTKMYACTTIEWYLLRSGTAVPSLSQVRRQCPGLETAYARRCASRYIVWQCCGSAGGLGESQPHCDVGGNRGIPPDRGNHRGG